MVENVSNENRPFIILHTGHFRSRFSSSVSFAIASLLFLLPFLNIKCNDTKLANVSGVQLAVGFKVKPSKDLNALTNGILGGNRRNTFDDRSTSSTDDLYKSDKSKLNDSLPPNYYLLTAMIMAVAATVISFTPFKHRWKYCYVAGWISVSGFVITIIGVLVELEQYSANFGFIELSVNFTAWFFISLLAVIAGALFSHNLDKIEGGKRREQEIKAYMEECGYVDEPLLATELASKTEV
jgi:hypothetical protein